MAITNTNPATTPTPGANAQPAAGGTAASNSSAILSNAFGAATAVPVDTSTLSAGISSLTNIVSIRQQRLATISVAIANAANTDPALSQVALARLNMEMSTAQNLNDQTKKLHDSLERSISTWTRP